MEISYVNNTIQFIDAIASNKTIFLKNNVYNLSNLLLDESEKIRYEKVFDGEQIIFDGIENLTITGELNTCIEILTEPRYANVITFRNSKNINLKNFTSGHTKEKGSCMGGVLNFENCNNITIDNCILFGCGTEGVTLNNCENIEITNTIIKECSEGIMTLKNSSMINFDSCFFFNNSSFYLIRIFKSNEVKFSKCSIYNNLTYSDEYSRNYIFDLEESKNILVNKCEIYDNATDNFTNNINELFLTETEVSETNNFYQNHSEDKSANTRDKTLFFSNKDFVLYEINDSKQIIFDNRNKIILRDKINDNDIIVNSILPSSPKISPDKSSIVYISPCEWEVMGDLHLYDIEDNSDSIIISAFEIKEQNCIKEVIWMDNTNLLLLIGFAYGTISIGGDLYSFDILTKKLTPIVICDDKEQIINISIDSAILTYDLVKYTDDFLDFTKQKIYKELSEVMKIAHTDL